MTAPSTNPNPDHPTNDVDVPATVDEDGQDLAESAAAAAAAPTLTTDQAAQSDDPVIQPGNS